MCFCFNSYEGPSKLFKQMTCSFWFVLKSHFFLHTCSFIVYIRTVVFLDIFLRKTNENVTKVGGDRQYDSYWLTVLSFFFCASFMFHLCFLSLIAPHPLFLRVVGVWLHWISLLFGTDCKLLWWPVLATRQSCRSVVHFYAGKEASYSIYGDQQILELQCQ